MKVLVFIEQRDGKIKNNAFEALTLASKITGNPGDVAALLVGSGVEGKAADLSGYGTDKVYVADAPEFELYNVMNYGAALESAIKDFGPGLVLGPASPMGRDILPRMAARLDGGIVTDVTTLTVENDQVTATKPMYAGKCLAEVTLKNSKIQFASLRPNVFGAEKSGNGSATVEKLSVSAPADNKLKTVEIRKGTSDKLDLTEAPIIVSGGRAMGNAENFKILDSCAEVLGATVGASRAAVDSGYAAHSMQVGQTGKTVNPNLYIACGISGSIQHMAGMRTSKVIVAINTDPEAPIFSVADYGIVADLFEAVPLMTEKLKTML